MTEMLRIGDFVGNVDVERDPPRVPASPAAWYLLRLHPSKERKVQAKLFDRGISIYVPTYTKRIVVRRQDAWRPAFIQHRCTPIFPGIGFVPDFDADLDMLKDASDGIGSFLRFGPSEARIGPTLMSHVRWLEAQLATPRSKREQVMKHLEVGDIVRIGLGNPFWGWAGRIDRLDDKGRLRVLVNAISHEVKVDLTVDQVEPV